VRGRKWRRDRGVGRVDGEPEASGERDAARVRKWRRDRGGGRRARGVGREGRGEMKA
jgi:hypothetical protein